MPSQTIRIGGLTGSVGNSSVGNGVSVDVGKTWVGVGAEVEVSTTVGRLVGASKDWKAGGSVAVGGSSVATGASVGAGAAAAQDVITNVTIRMIMIRRIIQTHFRSQAGQQVDSVGRDRISPVSMSAICTCILPFKTMLNAKVFPSGDQDGVSTRALSKLVI